MGAVTLGPHLLCRGHKNLQCVPKSEEVQMNLSFIASLLNFPDEQLLEASHFLHNERTVAAEFSTDRPVGLK